jgi:hypothetical protein
MSALGQKRTYAVQNGMSALPPIATSIAFFGKSALGHVWTAPVGKNFLHVLQPLFSPFRIRSTYQTSSDDEITIRKTCWQSTALDMASYKQKSNAQTTGSGSTSAPGAGINKDDTTPKSR